MGCKPVLVYLLMYYSGDHEEGVKCALITLHNLCKHPDFRDKMLVEHKYPLSIFDSFVKTALKKFESTLEAENWDSFTQYCSSISGFAGPFPERSKDF